eukprot:535266-Rhodomonas_salina.1
MRMFLSQSSCPVRPGTHASTNCCTATRPGTKSVPVQSFCYKRDLAGTQQRRSLNTNLSTLRFRSSPFQHHGNSRKIKKRKEKKKQRHSENYGNWQIQNGGKSHVDEAVEGVDGGSWG